MLCYYKLPIINKMRPPRIKKFSLRKLMEWLTSVREPRRTRANMKSPGPGMVKRSLTTSGTEGK